MFLEIFLGVFFALLAFDFCKSLGKLWDKHMKSREEHMAELFDQSTSSRR